VDGGVIENLGVGSSSTFNALEGRAEKSEAVVRHAFLYFLV
jgi:hypothetical protein